MLFVQINYNLRQLNFFYYNRHLLLSSSSIEAWWKSSENF